MEDKMFEMLSKIYGEMQEGFKGVRQEIKSLDGRMTSLEGNMVGLGERMTSLEGNVVGLENKMDENLKALYDGYKLSIEGIHELGVKVDNLTDQVAHQEIKLQVIKGSK